MRGGARQQSLGEALHEWGIPTAASVAYARRAGFRIIASGGIRTGLDAARAIALGADAAGLALPFLRAFAAGGTAEVLNVTAGLVESLRSIAMLVGAPSVEALRAAPRVLGPELRAWLD
jgi:isopentenyl-diphosphate delta-isomerase